VQGDNITNQDSRPRLTVFRSESGITISFGEKTYFIDVSEPFHNIALKALEGNDYIPFYVEVARREGIGEEFAESIALQVDRVLTEGFEE
tara:strand:+ start:2405 stop:2674 length:270 start_codon:yes stop_codon:yes gene_type:complete